MSRGRISKLFGYEVLKQVEFTEASSADIVTVGGFEKVGTSEALGCVEHPKSLPYLAIDEPTLAMNFIVNSSPFAGLEGKYVTSRNLRDRLNKELRTNVSLRVEDTANTDTFRVSGRGELHLSILIENMRREGFELSISRPRVLFKEDPETGERLEPVEEVVVDVDQEYSGVVIEKLTMRKGEAEKPPQQKERVKQARPEKKAPEPSTAMAEALSKSGFRVNKGKSPR